MAWTKQENPKGVDIDEFWRMHANGRAIIQEALDKGKKKKEERYKKIEEIRTEVFRLKPSKKYGGQK